MKHWGRINKPCFPPSRYNNCMCNKGREEKRKRREETLNRANLINIGEKIENRWNIGNIIQQSTERFKNRNTSMNFTWAHNTNNSSQRWVNGQYLWNLTAAWTLPFVHEETWSSNVLQLSPLQGNVMKIKYLDFESIPVKTSINKIISSLSLHEESYINSESWIFSVVSDAVNWFIFIFYRARDLPPILICSNIELHRAEVTEEIFGCLVLQLFLRVHNYGKHLTLK